MTTILRTIWKNSFGLLGLFCLLALPALADPLTVAVAPASLIKCAGQAASFTATPSGGVAPYTYQWYKGTGTANPVGTGTDTLVFSPATVGDAGNYWVRVTDSDAPPVSADSTEVTLTVNALPTVSVNSATICAGGTATLTATPTGTGPFTYSWSPGGAPTVSIDVTEAGTYTCTVTDANGCSAAGSGTVTVNPLPGVTVNSATICAGGTATLTATPTGTGPFTYSWSPGGATAVSIDVTEAGTYTCTVTDANGCSAPGSGTLTVNPLPTVSVNSATICPGGTATLTATATGNGPFTYSWSPGGATTVSIDVTVAGTYTCTVTDANGCVNSGSGTLTVQALLAATVANQSGCVGGSATFTAVITSGTATSYSWKNPSSVEIGTGPSVTLTGLAPADAGTYTVDITGPCNAVTVSATLTVNPLPSVTVNNATICAGGTATLTATPTGTGPFTYLWSPGGAMTVSIDVTVAGTYTCTVTDANGCSASGSGTLTVNPLPTVSVNNAITCPGVPVTLTATVTGTGPFTYSWSPGGEITDSISVSAAGTYTCTVTDANGCVNSGSGTLTLKALATVTMADQVVCPDGPATLTAAASGTGPLTYTFKKGEVVVQGPSSDSTYDILNTTSGDLGTYTVEVVGPCNTVSASADLSFYAIVSITAHPVSLNKNQGDAATFSVSVSSVAPVTYQWRLNTINIGGANNPSYTINGVSYADIGSYDVVVSNCAGGLLSAAATLSVAPITAIWQDFETIGQFTNNFNQRRDSTTVNGAAMQWAEVNSGGVLNSRALDGARGTGDDMTFTYHKSGFNFGRNGAVLRRSIFFKAKTASNNEVSQMGFIMHTNKSNPNAYITSLSSTNTSLNNNEGIMFMTGRIERQNNNMNHQIRMQHRTLTGTANPPDGSTVALVAGNWYKFTVAFTNNNGNVANQITFAENVQDMGADGNTPGAVVLTMSGNVINADIINWASTNLMYAAVRARENNGPDLMDNLAVWMTDGPIVVTYPPVSQTILQNRPVTFSAAVDGTPPYYFQWRKDGFDITGASNAYFTIARVASGDAGEYTVLVSSTPGGSGVESGGGVLTVTTDGTAPVLLSVGSLNGARIGARYDELLDINTATNPASYLLSSGTINYITLRPDGQSVEIILVSPIAGAFTVTATGVADLAGNPCASQSQSSTVMGWTALDVNGTDDVPPLTAGSTYVAKAGDFDVIAGGADLWDTSDDGHLLMSPARTGDFDVKVRIQKMTRYHLWDTATGRDDFAKAGIIARESIARNSKSIQAVAFPVDAGAPIGRDYFEYSYRTSTGGGQGGIPGANNGVDSFRNSPAFPNAWLRLNRWGNWFTYLISSNNVDWIAKASFQDTAGNFPNILLVGMGATAHYNAAAYPIGVEFRDFSDVDYSGAVISGVAVLPATTNVAAYTTVTFTANPSVTGASPSDFRYVWQRSNGSGGWTNIPGIPPYQASYTTPLITAPDTNNLASWQFRVIAYLNGQAPVTSTVGAITGIYDTTGPVISGATYVFGGNAVMVIFSEPVDAAAAGNINNWLLTNNIGQRIPLNQVVFYGNTTIYGAAYLYPSIVLTNVNNYGVVVSNIVDLWTPANLTVASFKLFNVSGQITYPVATAPVTYERYLNMGSSQQVSGLTNNSRYYFGYPDSVWYSNWFGVNATLGDNGNTYGGRVSTLFVPPTNGFYQFYIRSDDGGYLALNTNELASAEPLAKLVAYLNAYDGSYGRNSAKNAQGVYLAGGRQYYIEAVFKDNTGGDGIVIAVRTQGDTGTPAGTEIITNLSGTTLYAHARMTGAVSVASIVPSAATVTEGDYVTFRVTNVVGWRPIAAAWFKNGVLQPGLDEPAAKIGPIKLTDTTVSCLLSNPFSKTTISASLVVNPDNTAPTVVRARADGTLFRVLIDFNEDLDPVTAQTAGNYNIAGLTVHKAILAQNRTVILHTSTQAEGVTYTVNITGVKDISVAGTPANTSASFQSWIIGPAMAWREYWTNGMSPLHLLPNLAGNANQMPNSMSTMTNNPLVILHQPDLADVTNIFEIPAWPFAAPVLQRYGSGEFYAASVCGFFIPPTDGNYVFQMQHDDGGQFLLYTVAPNALNPDGVIASMIREYNVQGSYADIPTDSMTNTLVAGQRYYIEARFKEGTGGDYVRVGVRLPTDAPGQAIAASMSGSLIAAAGDPTATFLPAQMGFALQPVNAPDTVENTYASFTAVATNTLNWPMGYGWQKLVGGNWVDIPGVAGSNGLILVTLADDVATGTQFRSKAGVPGKAVFSDPVTVHVLRDEQCPTIASASGDMVDTIVWVNFSEKMDPVTTLNTNNYVFSGGIIVNEAYMSLDGKSVRLVLASAIPPGAYTVTVANVTDIAAIPNTICPNPATSPLFTAPWPVACNGNVVQYQFWYNIPTINNWMISNLTAQIAARPPDYTYYSNAVDLQQTPNEYYGLKISGVILPPVSGNYQFTWRADDSTRFTLSPFGDVSKGVTLLNSENMAPAGGCSSCSGVTTPPYTLTEGTKYAFELLFYEGTGGDYVTNFSWRLPGAGAFTRLDQSNLCFTVNPDSVQLTTTLQPVSQEIAEGRQAVLQVAARATVGAPTYQWQQYDGAGWTNIPGANGTTFGTGLLCEDVTGSQYRAVIGLSVVNDIVTKTNISDIASITVTNDDNAPYIVSIGSLDGMSIGVVFSEPIRLDTELWTDPSQRPFNWTIADSNIIANLEGTNGPTFLQYPVTSFSAWPNPNTNYSDKVILNLPYVTDFSPFGASNGWDMPYIHGPFSAYVGLAEDIACAANGLDSLGESAVMGLTLVDIADPYPVGEAFVGTRNRIEVVAGGADIWGTIDQFSFLQRPITGDFDARVTVVGIPEPPAVPPNTWAKAGLMVRGYVYGSTVTNRVNEGPATNSMMAYIVATPTNGVNVFAGGIRGASNSAAGDLGSGTRQSIAPSNNFPVIVRMVREGANITVYYWGVVTNIVEDPVGVFTTNYAPAWVLTGTSATVNWPDLMYVGLATTSHSQSNGVRATYEDFTLVARPTIVEQPISQVATSGIPVSFTVTGDGPVEGGALSYQWYKDGVAIPLATNATLTIANPTDADESVNYTVQVRNSGGATASVSVSLTVWMAPSITTAPTDQTAACGSSGVTFCVVAGGEGTLAYTWQYNGVDIIDQHATCLVLERVSRANTGPYTVVISSEYGSITSAPVNVILTDAVGPVFDALPNLGPFECPATVTYTVTATDECGGAVTIDCAPASGSVFPLGVTTVNCTATDLANNTTPGSFTVTVVDTLAPVISGCPGNQCVASGTSTVVTWTLPTALDACDGALIVTCTPARGSEFPVGTTPVDCVATDGQGNAAHCNFNVTVGPQPRLFYLPNWDPDFGLWRVDLSWPESTCYNLYYRFNDGMGTGDLASDLEWFAWPVDRISCTGGTCRTAAYPEAWSGTMTNMFFILK